MKTAFTFLLVLSIVVGFSSEVIAQTGSIKGKVISEGAVVSSVNITVLSNERITKSDSAGVYSFLNIPIGEYRLQVTGVGFKKMEKSVVVKQDETATLNFDLSNFQTRLDEVVVTGTLKAVNRLESPVPVEVYTPGYFKMNPTPSIFDALQNVNGVRPQLNCNICNTGDIHINGRS